VLAKIVPFEKTFKNSLEIAGFENPWEDDDDIFFETGFYEFSISVKLFSDKLLFQVFGDNFIQKLIRQSWPGYSDLMLPKSH
jgi:hypothetical protein